MARTNIVAQDLLGAYPTLPLSVGSASPGLTSTSDPTDRYTALVDSKTVLMVWNADSAPHTITIGSAPDTFNRTGDITAYSIAPDAIAFFGPFKAPGWANGGNLNIDVTDSHLQMAVITLP